MDIIAWTAGLPGDQIALGALVTAMVLSVLLGRVVPKSVMDARMADKDREIANLAKERDDWKTAHDKSEAGRAELKDQNSALIRGAETTNRLMESMRNYMERSSPPQRQIEE